MRVIRTFILRLLVNSAKPKVLHGVLQPMPEGEARPFADEETLVALLHREISGNAPPPSEQPGSDGETPG